MNKYSPSIVFKNGFFVLGIISSIGLVGYGLAYLIVMPGMSPGGFVPTTLEGSAGIPTQFGIIQAAFVLLYSFAFLPVNVMFTIKKFSLDPYALIFAACLICLSLLIEITNSLPIISANIYPGKLESIPSEVLLYLKQVESIKFLSYDVAGFTLAYAAIFIYAVVFFRTHRFLSYTMLASIVIFIANVPFLWFAPNMAVILMTISIFAFAAVPVFLARLAVE